MKVIGIILIVLQVFSIIGSISNGSIANLFNFASIPGISYTIGFFFPGILGIILLRTAAKRKAKREAEKNVIFYCPDCKAVREGIPNTPQGCPVCHKPAKETSVLAINWKQLTPEQQEQIKHTWGI